MELKGVISADKSFHLALDFLYLSLFSWNVEIINTIFIIYNIILEQIDSYGESTWISGFLKNITSAWILNLYEKTNLTFKWYVGSHSSWFQLYIFHKFFIGRELIDSHNITTPTLINNIKYIIRYWNSSSILTPIHIHKGNEIST